MTTEKTKEEGVTVRSTAADARALVREGDNEIATTDDSQGVALSNEFLAEISAEIQADLKALTIEQVTSPKKELLNKRLTLHDVFLMVFAGFAEPANNDDGTRAVFEVSDENGIVYYVAQSPTGSRLTYVGIWNNVRKAQRKLTLTNVEFHEVGRPKFGNQAVILQPTKDTQQVWE